jgi:hypothetical protein
MWATIRTAWNALVSSATSGDRGARGEAAISTPEVVQVEV